MEGNPPHVWDDTVYENEKTAREIALKKAASQRAMSWALMGIVSVVLLGFTGTICWAIWYGVTR